jgi:hypothetical protein
MEIIDNPEIAFIYEQFSNYFNDPEMKKIKDVDMYSMYLTKLYCLLNKDCRYIIVFVDKDTFPVNHTLHLSQLPWASLQTRTFSDYSYGDCKPHSYTVKNEGFLTSKINKINENSKCCTYECPGTPLICTLLIKETMSSNYKNTGTLVSALETFNTIITFKNK